MTSRIAESVGRVLGERYRLTRPLGAGATAAVYAGEDVKLRRRVAVKVLHPGLASEEAFLRHFRREAQAVASLNHPNILNVYDWGDEGGTPYLVMELLEGGTLRSMLNRGAFLSAAQAAAVGAGAARALAHAHQRGIVHRDIKPANLIFDIEGHVHVADFGLARALAEASLTEPMGSMVGTLRYSSPELVRGEPLDAKSDVYSLALVLVEAMTGTVPFALDTPNGSRMARLARSVEPPGETGPLAPVLAAAGTLEVADRLDAATLARRLEELASRLPYPAPLSLASNDDERGFEPDDINPTVMPGRPRLFDRESAETQDLPAAAPPLASGGVGPTESLGRPATRVYDDGGDGRPGPPAPPRRRRRRAAVIVGAALLLLAGGGAAWALTSGTFVPDEPVPNVIGMPWGQATAAVANEHLHLTVTGQEYSDKAAGDVVTQSPAQGKLKRGGDVRVVVSKGPAPVRVPAIVGSSLQDAIRVLQGLGLKWTTTNASSMTVAKDLVISTDPSSGTIIPGQSMALVVSSGKPKVAVPAITLGSEPVAQAEAALKQVGLAYTATVTYSNTVPRNDVIAVSPASGAQAEIGSTVALTISQGPHYAIVPPTKDDSVGAATEALDAAGFNVTGVNGNPTNTVKGTDPPAGQQVLYGSSIVIVTR